MTDFAPALQGDIHEAMPHKTRKAHPWLIAIGSLIVGVVVLAIIGAAQQNPVVRCGPPQCAVPPPSASVLPAPAHFTSSKYGFSLDYDASLSPSSTDASSISWDANLHSDGSEVTWTFAGTTPSGRGPQQIVNDIQQNRFADATLAYNIPGADIGYTPGYGNVYDLSVAPGGGTAMHERLIIMSSVKRNVAVAFIGMGEYRRTNPKDDQHPNPADTPLVNLGILVQSLKSVTWKGDPPL